MPFALPVVVAGSPSFTRLAIPADLPPEPYRAAMELANAAMFTQGELDAYRKVMDEIQQAREYGAAQRAEGKAEGLSEVGLKWRREALLRLLARAKIDLAGSDRARIQACSDVETLNRWIGNVIGAGSVSDVLA